MSASALTCRPGGAEVSAHIPQTLAAIAMEYKGPSDGHKKVVAELGAHFSRMHQGILRIPLDAHLKTAEEWQARMTDGHHALGCARGVWLVQNYGKVVAFDLLSREMAEKTSVALSAAWQHRSGALAV